jgi:hypothetical protein
MMWADLSFNPATKLLRQFAASGCALLGLVAVWRGWAHRETTAAAMLAVASLALGLVGLIRPRWLKPVYLAAMVAAFPIGWVVSRVVLALVYYGVFTPVGLVFRLIGRDPLELREPKSADTYWKPKPAPRNASSYFRQY